MRTHHRILAGLVALLFLLCTPANSRENPEVDIAEILEPADEDGTIVGSLLNLVLDPTDVKAHIHLGNLYASQKKLDLARRAYRRALTLNPTNAAAWNNLGVVYLQQRKPHKATSCFKEAIDVDPQHALAHYNLASVLDVNDKYDAALEHYRIAFHARPDLANVRDNPFVVYNAHVMPALMLNYLDREDYALLVDAPRPVEPSRVVGVAELAEPAGR
ncbi:MAG: tetratricopeptide repeat protein [Acidobacteriota bacterium]